MAQRQGRRDHQRNSHHLYSRDRLFRDWVMKKGDDVRAFQGNFEGRTGWICSFDDDDVVILIDGVWSRLFSHQEASLSNLARRSGGSASCLELMKTLPNAKLLHLVYQLSEPDDYDDGWTDNG